jgi:hypothetical protein
MSKSLLIAIFLESWLQSSPWPDRLDSRHRILAKFEAINRVADTLRRAAEGHAPLAHPRPLAIVTAARGEGAADFGGGTGWPGA